MSPVRGVVTPEAVVVDLDEADIGSRLVARLLDAAVQVVGTGLLVTGLGAIGSAVPGMPTWAATSGVIFLVFAGLLGYPVAIETLWRGKSLGKAAFGLRVVTVEGGPARFRHAIIRAALGLVELYATLGSLAVVSAMVSNRHQRLGDLVAGTVVRRERTGAPMPEVVSFHLPPELEAYAATIDVSGLGVADYEAARSFLLRAATLDQQSRVDLARRLAEPLATRVAHNLAPGMWPETFLLCLAAAWQRRHAGMPGTSAQDGGTRVADDALAGTQAQGAVVAGPTTPDAPTPGAQAGFARME